MLPGPRSAGLLVVVSTSDTAVSAAAFFRAKLPVAAVGSRTQPKQRPRTSPPVPRKFGTQLRNQAKNHNTRRIDFKCPAVNHQEEVHEESFYVISFRGHQQIMVQHKVSLLSSHHTKVHKPK